MSVMEKLKRWCHRSKIRFLHPAWWYWGKVDSHWDWRLNYYMDRGMEIEPYNGSYVGRLVSITQCLVRVNSTHMFENGGVYDDGLKYVRRKTALRWLLYYEDFMEKRSKVRLLNR